MKWVEIEKIENNRIYKVINMNVILKKSLRRLNWDKLKSENEWVNQVNIVSIWYNKWEMDVYGENSGQDKNNISS